MVAFILLITLLLILTLISSSLYHNQFQSLDNKNEFDKLEKEHLQGIYNKGNDERIEAELYELNKIINTKGE